MGAGKNAVGASAAPQKGEPSARTAEGRPDSPFGEGLNPAPYASHTLPLAWGVFCVDDPCLGPFNLFLACHLRTSAGQKKRGCGKGAGDGGES